MAHGELPHIAPELWMSSQVPWCELSIIPLIPVALLGAGIMTPPPVHEIVFQPPIPCGFLLHPAKASVRKGHPHIHIRESQAWAVKAVTVLCAQHPWKCLLRLQHLPSTLLLLCSFIRIHSLLHFNSKLVRARNDGPCYCQANRNGAKVGSLI